MTWWKIYKRVIKLFYILKTKTKMFWIKKKENVCWIGTRALVDSRIIEALWKYRFVKKVGDVYFFDKKLISRKEKKNG